MIGSSHKYDCVSSRRCAAWLWSESMHTSSISLELSSGPSDLLDHTTKAMNSKGSSSTKITGKWKSRLCRLCLPSGGHGRIRTARSNDSTLIEHSALFQTFEDHRQVLRQHNDNYIGHLQNSLIFTLPQRYSSEIGRGPANRSTVWRTIQLLTNMKSKSLMLPPCSM